MTGHLLQPRPETGPLEGPGPAAPTCQLWYGAGCCSRVVTEDTAVLDDTPDW